MKTLRVTLLLCAVSIAAPAQAQNVLTTHRLPAALASEVVAEAVASCAKQGYKVTASIVDTDGVVQTMLRGDGASMTTLGAARDKAYTALMLGGPRNEDSSGAVAFDVTHVVVMAGLVPAIHVLGITKRPRRGCPAQGRA